MEAAKNVVNNLLGRGDDTTTGQSGNPTGQGYGNESVSTSTSTGTKTETGAGTGLNTRDDEYVERYGVQGKGAGSGATAQVDSGSTTTGTALGGRTHGNTADSAVRASGGVTEDADGYDGDASTTDDYGRSTSENKPHAGRPAKPIGTEPTAYHQVTGSTIGSPADQYGIGKTSTGINETETGQMITDGAADYRAAPGTGTGTGTGTGALGAGVGSGVGTGVGSGLGSGIGSGVGAGYGTSAGTGTDTYATSRNTGISSETYPQTSSSNTSGLPGVASGDTYPRSGDLSSRSDTATGGTGSLTETSSTTRDRSDDLTSKSHTSTSVTGEKKDPALTGERGSKLTGTGEDGSHSAVFGLTPDGHKYTDTSHHSAGNVQPAHSDSPEDTKERSGAPPTGKETVADQINDPRANERADGRDPTYNSGSDTKPGAGFQAGSPDQNL